MVELGQELARKHGLDNLEYRLGDIEAPPIKPGTVDLALLSQALHHAQKPSRALEAAWDILKSGGCLVVLDLLQHGQEEARELYADRWLGFTPAALESMLKEAGFRNIHTDIVDRGAGPAPFPDSDGRRLETLTYSRLNPFSFRNSPERIFRHASTRFPTVPACHS